jgi:preprotein translocase subunit SecA
MNQLYQMLRAYILLERDVDYIVSGNEVVLVDPHTGRSKPESRYQHGLQSAIEAKEQVAIRPESKILGEISVRGLLGQYQTLCGMTGTGMHAKTQFRRTSDEKVTQIRLPYQTVPNRRG